LYFYIFLFYNKGIGSSLLNTLLHLADHDLGLIRLELDVVVDNEPAIHLYKENSAIAEL
jgi:putative acetyltransferase